MNRMKKCVGLMIIAMLLIGCTKEVIQNPTVEFPEIYRNERNIDNKHGVYYQIFVRAFADSSGDGIGDIKGLIGKLDYLNDGDPSTKDDLGVEGIWLMPITVSPTYHKYDVVDYFNIDPEYGTLEDFEELLEEAQKRGIKVIMDLVINHTSSQHPWFLESKKSKDNPFRDYYTWAEKGHQYNLKGLSLWNTRVWHPLNDSHYYGVFWDQMPDLNFDNPKVREEIKSIAKFWLDKGVDGFRLDAVTHIYGIHENLNGSPLSKNNQFWREFGAYCEEINPDVYLVGEAWTTSDTIATYYSGLDTNFNFWVGEHGIFSIVNSGLDLYGPPNRFVKELEKIYQQNSEVEPLFLDAPFLTNHDQNRTMSRLDNDVEKAKLAANMYLTLPGNPFIYYGEEIGMLGTGEHENIREPMVWFEESRLPQSNWRPNINNKDTVSVEVQQQDADSLLNHYKKLIKVRKENVALTKGDFKGIEVDSNKVIAYSRTFEMEEMVILHNVNPEEQTIVLDHVELKNMDFIFESTGDGKNIINGNEITLAPRTTVILKKPVVK